MRGFVSLIKAGLKVALLLFRWTLSRKWLAKMTKTRRENENEYKFRPWRTLAIRKWNGAVRADPAHSSELRRASWLSFDEAFGLWGWLGNVHSRRDARLCRSNRSPSDR